MSNPFYTHGVFPAPNSPGASAPMRAELELVTAAFAKLPLLTGNGSKLVVIKSDESGMTATTSVTGITFSGGVIEGSPIGALTPASGSFTTLSVSGPAVLGSQVNIAGGVINGTVIGGTTRAAGSFTTLSASSGITGNLTGNVTGNLTGNVTGNVAGDVTSTGSSTFNNVTINGTLNMDAASVGTIINLTDPTNAQDAATKNYVDTKDALKLNLAGGTMSGAIAMSNNKITGLATPTNAADAANKGYVDLQVSNLVASAPGALDTLNELAVALGNDANFSTTITNALATKLPLAGGTMTGAIVMSGFRISALGDPTLAQDASTKNYTDARDALKLNLAGGTMTGAIAMSANKITGMADPVANQDAATKVYVDTQRDTRLALAGGTMAGVIAMGGNKITGLATPTNAQDATTKVYVDGILGSGEVASAAAAAALASQVASANSASASATSASASANSAAAAAASYDSFDDRYLGPKAADPTVDNDGNTLLEGALYWSTTAKIMKIWTGAQWSAAYIPTSGYVQKTGDTLVGDLTAPNFIGELRGNAATVTHGVYTTESYEDPDWLASISALKVQGLEQPSIIYAIALG